MFAAPLVAAPACLFVIPEPQATTGQPDVGGETDVPDVGDAGSDTSEGGAPNIIFNGSFDTAACDGWVAYNATITPATTARSGSTSCKVCRVPGAADSFFSFYPTFGSPSAVKNLPAGRYTGEVWVRKAPGAPDLTGTFLNGNFIDPLDNVVFFTEGGHQSPTDAWTRLGVIFDKPTADADSLALSMSVNSVTTVDTCILVDDLSVRLSN